VGTTVEVSSAPSAENNDMWRLSVLSTFGGMEDGQDPGAQACEGAAAPGRIAGLEGIAGGLSALSMSSLTGRDHLQIGVSCSTKGKTGAGNVKDGGLAADNREHSEAADETGAENVKDGGLVADNGEHSEATGDPSAELP
jgi:hypothetical protein